MTESSDTSTPSISQLATDIVTQPSLAVRTVSFEFEWGDVVAEPTETIWQFWWSKIIGPEPVLALAYLHHIAASHRTVDDLAEVLTSTLTPIDRSQLAVDLNAIDLLSPLIAYRLVFAERDRNGDGTALGLGLISPIPRPSRSSSDSITAQLEAAARTRP